MLLSLVGLAQLSLNQNLMIWHEWDFEKLIENNKTYPIVDFDAVSFVSLDAACFWLVLNQ